jgi:hypothetical protein
MSNIVRDRYLIHCAAVALALCTAFVVAMPKADTPVASAAVDVAKSACVQSWPYYEHSCLRQSRAGDDDVQAVRVIALSGQASRPASRH